MSHLIKPEPRIFELPIINTQRKVGQIHERNAFCRQSVGETVLKIKATCFVPKSQGAVPRVI